MGLGSHMEEGLGIVVKYRQYMFLYSFDIQNLKVFYNFKNYSN